MIDTSKKYVCYFCEEEIEYSLPAEDLLEILTAIGANITAQWRHSSNKKIDCNTVATPSNLEIVY